MHYCQSIAIVFVSYEIQQSRFTGLFLKHSTIHVGTCSLCNFKARANVPPASLYVSYFIRDLPVKERKP